MPLVDRWSIAAHVVERIVERREPLRRQWRRDPIANLQIDEVLPAETARELYDAFPPLDCLTPARSLRESRYLGVQLERYEPLLRETVYAFQDPRVIDAIAELTDQPGLLREREPGASGISLMDRGGFLNPNVHGSGDVLLHKRHALSLLYYVTPDLRLADGGHLELWHDGPENEPTTILSKFNRLVVMASHTGAWHSVSPLRTRRRRCCLWNYYYAAFETRPANDNVVAAYRGRPDQKLRDLLLRADTFARQSMYRFVLDRRLEQDSVPVSEAGPAE